MEQALERSLHLGLEALDRVRVDAGQGDVGAEPEDDEEAEPYISFGSSIGLQRELVELTNLLQQAGVPSNSAPFRCLRVLREAADQSVANDLPIIVW